MNTTQHARFSTEEIKAFKHAKKVASLDYETYFIPYTYLLWSSISESEYNAIGIAAFKGYLNNKHTRDASNETSNAVLNEP